MKASEVASASRYDPIITAVHRYRHQGWPHTVPEELKPYRQRKDEITAEGNCLLWGSRVVIPTKLRERVLEELHDGHPGVVRMKQAAHGILWWPGIDKQIENTVKGCDACQQYRNAPALAPLHVWSWPSHPWERVHIDFLGPFMGKMILVVTDAHSKWPEAIVMKSTTSERTIAVLREIFARNGLPQQLVSDNGPQFCSSEFQLFMQRNGIRHSRVAPYHPASNGAAELMVQSIKQALRSASCTGVPLEHALATFLLRYRSTPHATMGVPPCTLFMGRKLRMRLDLLTPDVASRVRKQQSKQEEHHDQHAQLREFQAGQVVWARNLRGGPHWKKAVIQDRLGPLSYMVRLEDGDLWRRHVDHLREGPVIQQPDSDDNRSESPPEDVVHDCEEPPSLPGVVEPLPDETAAREEFRVR